MSIPSNFACRKEEARDLISSIFCKMRYMRFSSLLLLLIGVQFPLCLKAQLTEINGYPQAPNYDFEVWDNDARPWAWSSSSNFEAGHAASRINRRQSVWKSTNLRPGAQGAYSAYIKVTQSSWYHYQVPFGTTSYEDMGTLTTGVLYYYDSKTNSKSCIYTNTGDGSKHWAFTGRPDSVVFWAKLGSNGGRNGDMCLYLHDNSKFEDRGNGITATGTVIGSANVKIRYNGGQWVRYSVPIHYTSSANPAYLLLSFTAGNSFREVVNGDEMWVDDILLVYNPKLHIGSGCPVRLVRHGGTSQDFSIPFELSIGTESPKDPVAENEVRAYLSDENGSFENPLQIGSVFTTKSGTISATIPEDLPDSDKYRLKLVSANYPVESEELGLSIYREWYLSVRPSGTMGSVTPMVENELCRHHSIQTLKADPHDSCVFLGWQEHGAVVWEQPEYAFSILSDRDLTALFDTTYALRLASVAGADSYFANNNSQEVILVNGDTAYLRLTLDYGYEFQGYDFNGQVYSKDSPDFDYEARQGGIFYPLVDSIPYEFSFEVWPDAKLGKVEGGGIHKHFSSFAAVAHAASPYSHFRRWEDSKGRVLGTDSILLFENVSAGGHYRAVFEEEMHSVEVLVAQGQEAWGRILQGGIPAVDSQYSAFDVLDLSLKADPASGYAFSRFEIVKDGVSQAPLYDSVLDLTPQGHLASDYKITAYFDTACYEVKALARHGRVVGAGTYKYGETACLWVVPDEGYHFESWNENGYPCGSGDTLMFTVLSDRVLEAVMSLNTYSVSMEVYPEGWGSLQPGSGTYAHFETLDLRAMPASQREFAYWVIDGDTISSSSVYAYEVRKDAGIVAVFDWAHYQVEAVSSDPMQGFAIGQGRYRAGERVELLATSFEGYDFDHWSNACGQRFADNPLWVENLSSDTLFEAHFVARPCHVAVQVQGPGMVTDGKGQQIEDMELDYGTLAEFHAVPSGDDYVFEAWRNLSGEVVNTDNPWQCRVLSDTSLVACFSLKSYRLDLSVSPAGAGILAGGGVYPQGTEVVVKAEPRPGYRFAGWYEGAELLSLDTGCTFLMDKDVFAVARFEEESYCVGIKVEPAEAAFSFSGQGVYKTASNTLLEVEPVAGYELAAWVDSKGDTLSADNPFLHEVRGDAELTAWMQAARIGVEFTVEPASGGRVESDDCRFGQMATAKAVPAYGYRFLAWKDAAGNLISENPILHFSSKVDTGFKACFGRADFEVKAVAAEGGSITGAGSAPYLSYPVLKAEAEENYRFAGWFDSEGECLSMLPEWSFCLRGDMELEARFKPLDVSWQVSVFPKEAGGVSEQGQVLPSICTASYGSVHRFAAWASPAWKLEGWRVEKNGKTEDFAVDTLCWCVEGGEIVTAIFDTNRYFLHVEAEGLPENAAWVLQGEGEYAYGKQAGLWVEAPEHYRFTGYFDPDGRLLSESPGFSMRMIASIILKARFESEKYRIEVLSADVAEGGANGTGIYAFDSVVEISAYPYEGYTFSHWASDREGWDTLARKEVFMYTVAQADSVYAFFKPSWQFLEQRVAAGEGSVLGQGRYERGSEACLRAIAAEGYHFSAWMENGNLIGEKPEMAWIMDRDYCIEAVFEPDTFALELDMVWVGEGSLPESLKFQGAGKYAYGSPVAVSLQGLSSAVAFKSWTDETGKVVSEQAGFVYSLRQDTRLQAHVGLRECRIDVFAEGNGQVRGGGLYCYGDTALLVAEAFEGMRLFAWKVEDALIEAVSDTLQWPVRSSATCTAVFGAEEVLVQAWPNWSKGGKVAGGGAFLPGRQVCLKAEPEEGYRFLYWSVGDSLVSEEAVLNMEAAEVPAVVAHFEEVSLYVRLQASMPEGVSFLEGAGSYRKGQEAELGIGLREGYRFEGWYCIGESGEERLLSEQENYSLVVETAMEIQARVSKR